MRKGQYITSIPQKFHSSSSNSSIHVLVLWQTKRHQVVHEKPLGCTQSSLNQLRGRRKGIVVRKVPHKDLWYTKGNMDVQCTHFGILLCSRRKGHMVVHKVQYTVLLCDRRKGMWQTKGNSCTQDDLWQTKAMWMYTNFRLFVYCRKQGHIAVQYTKFYR